jgi:hypothetical protein
MYQSNSADRANQFGAWVLGSRGAQAVLLANLAPLASSIWFGWDAFTVVFVYWLENLVIGGFNVLRILFAHGGAPSYVEFYRRQPLMLMITPILTAFFIFHYFFFCYGHGIFLFLVFDKDASAQSNLWPSVASELTWGVVLSLAALVAEHAFWFYRNFCRRGDYKRYHPVIYLFLPYGRVALVHCVLLFGALLVELLSLPSAIVGLLLIALKLGPELLSVRINEAMGEPAATAEQLAERAAALQDQLEAFMDQRPPRRISWFVYWRTLGASWFFYVLGVMALGIGSVVVIGAGKAEGISPLLIVMSLIPAAGLAAMVLTLRYRSQQKQLLREGLCCEARVRDVEATNIRVNGEARYKVTFEFDRHGAAHQATSNIYGPAVQRARLLAENGSSTRILVDRRDVARVLWIDCLLAKELVGS